MKYLLFISYSSGLKHNSIYERLNEVHESILQLVEEENLNIADQQIPSVSDIYNHLEYNDDYIGKLSNGSWYHIQGYPVFEK